jgi:phosphoribosylformimino-5-aminoimidazole carboxamide ribonucleotide (ProFAR) isomerase
MKINIDGNDLLKHLSFWHNKTDDECIELATNEYSLDAEQALLNMLERDFCTDINNNVVEELMNWTNE